MKGSRQRQRDNNFQSLRNVLLSLPPQINASNLLREIEDRRDFHPERAARPARSFKSPRHQLTIPKNQMGNMKLPSAIGFKDPDRVLICVRRKQRRSVLFAKKKHKKGAGSKRSRSYYSNIQC